MFALLARGIIYMLASVKKGLMTCILLASALQNSFATTLPEGFVYLAEYIPDIELDIRYDTEDNFVGEPIDGYLKPRAIISLQAAQALKKVQAELKPFGLGLKVFDAYRPQQSVAHFVRWAKDLNDTRMKAKYYPKVDKQNLFRDGYIAERSSHTRGSTVDLTIVSNTKAPLKALDMGSAWDYFGPLSWPENLSVTAQQRANRMLLRTLMLKHNFRALDTEWWHFTFNDEPFPDTYFDFPVQ